MSAVRAESTSPQYGGLELFTGVLAGESTLFFEGYGQSYSNGHQIDIHITLKLFNQKRAGEGGLDGKLKYAFLLVSAK